VPEGFRLWLRAPAGALVLCGVSPTSPTPFHPRFPIGMQFALLNQPRPLVQTVQPLSTVSADVVERPIEVLVEQLYAFDTGGGQSGLTTAEAAAIIAFPLGVGFGLFAVVVSFSDPVTAAIWSIVAMNVTVMVMRYPDTNRAMKAIAAWIANTSQNDKKDDR
jgi:hypothetical protein